MNIHESEQAGSARILAEPALFGFRTDSNEEEFPFMHSSINRMMTCVAILALFSAVGCGKKQAAGKATVTGTVTYKNAPVKGAVVTFMAGSDLAAGTTDENGRFTIPNVPVGQAKVTVRKTESSGTSKEMTPDEMRKKFMAKKKVDLKEVLPKKYANPSTTDLTADVSSTASDNDFKFDLK